MQQLAAVLGREQGQVDLTLDLAEFARFTLDPRLTGGGDAAPDAEGYYDGLVFRAYVAGDAQPVGALDIVQTGRTLAENGLVELEAVAEVAPVVVLNRASYQRHRRELNALFDRLEAAGVAA